MATKYFATYSQHFDRDKGQDYGRLCFRSLDTDTDAGTTELVLIATMSTASKQGSNSIHERGGLMPPEYRVNDLAKGNGRYTAWTLETQQQYRATKGIEGACFQILPVYIKTDQGTTRGEFFVHEDKNVEGTLGCIALTKERFDQVKTFMAKLAKQGIRAMPLFLTYS